jgi:hypothetical protein
MSLDGPNREFAAAQDHAWNGGEATVGGCGRRGGLAAASLEGVLQSFLAVHHLV